MSAPRYRDVVKPALLTGALSLLAFGLAHVAFITWVPSPPQDGAAPPPLALRMLVMLVAPIALGALFAIAASLLAAGAWTFARGERLRSARLGIALAAALVPPVALSLVHGPYGEETPTAAQVGLVMAAIFLGPASLAAHWGGPRAGLSAGAAGLVLVAPWTLFLMPSGLVGWVIPFVVSLFAILLTSGLLMARLSEAISRRAQVG